MSDTRTEIKRLLSPLEFSSWKVLTKFILCAALAACIAFLPQYLGLTLAGRWALFILLFAAGLWITEAIPAFAVALLIIGLEIAILGRPGGPFATTSTQWQIFVRPWSSPLIWLFFGGFVLAAGATKTGGDRWLARRVLGKFGQKPDRVLLGVMVVTFTLSMFISNTATTAMMITITGSLVGSLSIENTFGKALLLGVPFSANLGGMATIIGTPPNAIAAGALAWTTPISFPKWMMAGLPPSLALAGILWLYLKRQISQEAEFIDPTVFNRDAESPAQEPMWRRTVVILVFLLTAGLWLTGPLHGIPTPVVSFIPITIFAVTGVLGAEDIRRLHWDVLLLMTGGLSLGVAVAETGLAKWIVNVLPLEGFGPAGIALILAYVAAIISNFVSNTAVANILVPIALPMAAGFEAQLVVPVALGASTAMCFAISTPPNAIAFSTGRLTARDLFRGGIFMGILGPPLAVLWSSLVL